MGVPEVSTKAIDDDFATVKSLLENEELVTRGVDAYCLSIIKAERQARRIFTFLCYQSDFFSEDNTKLLINALAAKTSIYFEGFDKGTAIMIGARLQDLAGQVRPDWGPHRNKLFHGQITGSSIGRGALEKYSAGIEAWCRALFEGARLKIGYGGFERNSLRKSGNAGVAKQVTSCISSGAAYEEILGRISRNTH